jgi:hypothetical protein
MKVGCAAVGLCVYGLVYACPCGSAKKLRVLALLVLGLAFGFDGSAGDWDFYLLELEVVLCRLTGM